MFWVVLYSVIFRLAVLDLNHSLPSTPCARLTWSPAPLWQHRLGLSQSCQHNMWISCHLAKSGKYFWIFLCYSLFASIFLSIRPSPELLPVLGPLERYVMLTLDVALICNSRAGSDLGHKSDWLEEHINIEHAHSGYSLPKRASIHQHRVKSVIRPPLYPQATTAELFFHLFIQQKLLLIDSLKCYSFL